MGRGDEDQASADPYQSVVDACARRAVRALALILLRDEPLLESLEAIAAEVGASDPYLLAAEEWYRLDGFSEAELVEAADADDPE
jgi:hypothetical protein